jgi:hypothetical protein
VRIFHAAVPRLVDSIRKEHSASSPLITAYDRLAEPGLKMVKKVRKEVTTTGSNASSTAGEEPLRDRQVLLR